METKDIITSIGIGLTFIVGAVGLIVGAFNLKLTLRTTRESRFINTVTAERVKWIQELRSNISKFCGATFSYAAIYAGKPSSTSTEAVELLKDIDRLGFLIRLQLNPKEEPDQQIEAITKKIPNLIEQPKLHQLTATLEELTTATQALLKKEWEKVKQEAKKGEIQKQANMS
jgi:vacuolar-type H+-ATPase subunit I/STV1